MKAIILVAILILTLFLSGCSQFMFSHNATQLANGQYVKFALGDYGLIFGEGTLFTQAVRENTKTSITMQKNNDFSGAPTSKIDLVESIEIYVGPQVTGYLVDLAGVSSDAAAAYVGTMSELNNNSWNTKQTAAQTKQSSGKKSTSDNYIDYLKAKLASISGGAAMPTLSEIKGDGEYNDLYADRSITAQATLTAELLKYADAEAKMPETGEALRDTLVHYAGRLAQLKAKGKTESVTVTLGRATIKGGKLTALMYRLKEDDGTYRDEECPSCFPLED